MKPIQKIVQKTQHPVRVLQFGEGNFLRGFADLLIDCANEASGFDAGVVIVKPRGGALSPAFAEQDHIYTVCLRGNADGAAVERYHTITCIRDAVDPRGQYELYMQYAFEKELRFVISNTTEAGIVYDETDSFELSPPNSFPGKVTKLLYERCVYFNYAPDKGLIFLPCELIDDNGTMLKACVRRLAERWDLGDRFLAWLDEACIFANTLVDRMVTGYPTDEADAICEKCGYTDRLLVCGEPFGLWVIESDREIARELPLPDTYVKFTDHLKPYKQRKVRILNGAHTSFCLASYLCGYDYVVDAVNDLDIRAYLKETLHREIIPTLTMPQPELLTFAQDVLERFENPYIRHSLLAISLNSVSKWRARCLPTVLDSIRNTGLIPSHLAFSLAALLAFYHGKKDLDGRLLGKRGDDVYEIKDDLSVLAFFDAHYGDEAEILVSECLSRKDFWGMDLTSIDGFAQEVCKYLTSIYRDGMRTALQTVCGGGN